MSPSARTDRHPKMHPTAVPPSNGVSPFQPTQRGMLSATTSTSRASAIPSLARPHGFARLSHLCDALQYAYVIFSIHERDDNDSSLADDILGPLSLERYMNIPAQSTAALKFLMGVAMNEGFRKAAELEKARKCASATCPTPRSSTDSQLPSTPDPMFNDFVALASRELRSYQPMLGEYCRRNSQPNQRRDRLPENLVPDAALYLRRVCGIDMTSSLGSGASSQVSEKANVHAGVPTKIDVVLVFDESSKTVALDWKEIPKDAPPTSTYLTRGKSRESSSDRVPFAMLLDKNRRRTHSLYCVWPNAPLTALDKLVKDLETIPNSNKRAQSEITVKSERPEKEIKRSLTSAKKEIADNEGNDEGNAGLGDFDVITIADSDNERDDEPVKKDVTKKGMGNTKSGDTISPLYSKRDQGNRRTSPRNKPSENPTANDVQKTRKKEPHPATTGSVGNTPKAKIAQSGPLSARKTGRKSTKQPTKGTASSSLQSKLEKSQSHAYTKRSQDRRKEVEESDDDDEAEDVIHRRLRDNTRGRRVSFELPGKQRGKQPEIESPSSPPPPSLPKPTSLRKAPQQKQSLKQPVKQIQKKPPPQKQKSATEQTKLKPDVSEDSDDDVQFVSTKRSTRRQRRTRSSKAVTESSDSDDHYRSAPDGDFKPAGKSYSHTLPSAPDPSSAPPTPPNISTTDGRVGEENLATSSIPSQSLVGLPGQPQSIVSNPSVIPPLLSDTAPNDNSQLPLLLHSTMNSTLPLETPPVTSLLNQRLPSQPSTLPLLNQALPNQTQLMSSQGGLPGLTGENNTGSMQLPLGGSFSRWTGATGGTGTGHKLKLNNLDKDTIQFIEQLVAKYNDESSPTSSLPRDSMLHEEIEIDRMVAAAGTGSPDLSDYDDPSKTAEEVGYLPLVRGILGQIKEKKVVVTDCEHFEMDEDVNAYYRESRTGPEYAPSDSGGRTIGTQFIVDQQMTKNGPWAYRQLNNETAYDDVDEDDDEVEVIAQGGPAYSSNTNTPGDRHFTSLGQSPEAPYSVSGSHRHLNQRTYRTARTIKTRRRMANSMGGEPSFATSSAMPHHHEVNTIHEPASSGHDTEYVNLDVGYDQDVGEMDGGHEEEIVLDQNGDPIADEDGYEIVDGSGRTKRRRSTDGPNSEEEAIKLQRRICGPSWDGMSEKTKNDVLRWARHDFSWFGEGRNSVQINAQRIPINCPICAMKGPGNSENVCERTILIKLYRDMSWRKVQRLKHHVTTE